MPNAGLSTKPGLLSIYLLNSEIKSCVQFAESRSLYSKTIIWISITRQSTLRNTETWLMLKWRGHWMLCWLKQQGFFTKRHTSRDAAAKTSFVLSHKTATNSETFSEGEFVKEDSAALICPEKNTHLKKSRCSGQPWPEGSRTLCEIWSFSCNVKQQIFAFSPWLWMRAVMSGTHPVTHIRPWDNGLQDYIGAGSNVLTERANHREWFIHRGKCVHGQTGTEWDRRAGVTKHGCPNLMG